jgi:hypothetical protein
MVIMAGSGCHPMILLAQAVIHHRRSPPGSRPQGQAERSSTGTVLVVWHMGQEPRLNYVDMKIQV